MGVAVVVWLAIIWVRDSNNVCMEAVCGVVALHGSRGKRTDVRRYSRYLCLQLCMLCLGNGGFSLVPSYQ